MRPAGGSRIGAPLRDLLIAASLVAIGAGKAPAHVVAADRQRVLDAHNRLRCSVEPPAKAMPALSWDPLLEQVAQEWADTCPTTHNDNRSRRYQKLGGSGYVGENMAWGYSSWTRAILDGWGREGASYDYASNTCHDAVGVARECGHYTQLVWAGTRRVGCALPSVSCLGSLNYYVCNYAPGGNLGRRRPYVSGVGANEACAATTAIAPLAYPATGHVVAGAMVTLDGSGQLRSQP